jgi:hypothetical protein
MYVTDFTDSKGNLTTLPVSTYFANNGNSVDAIVTTTAWGSADVPRLCVLHTEHRRRQVRMGSYAQALMMMHESIHLAGFGDAVFGGSKQLTNILIDNCYPVIKQHLGGLVQ